MILLIGKRESPETMLNAFLHKHTIHKPLRNIFIDSFSDSTDSCIIQMKINKNISFCCFLLHIFYILVVCILNGETEALKVYLGRI